MIKTGVCATEEERAELRKLAHEASTTPMLLMGGVDVAGEAWRRTQHRCHELALAHGLPEIPGYYGITNDGEFVRTE